MAPSCTTGKPVSKGTIQLPEASRPCGKATLVRALAPRFGYVTFDDADALALARSDPIDFLAALPDPVILDEIQRVPELLRALKLSVDRNRRAGRFVLTGSANLLLLPKLGDSLAGRMTILELHPLTAAEQDRAPGGFLAAWLAGKLSQRHGEKAWVAQRVQRLFVVGPLKRRTPWMGSNTAHPFERAEAATNGLGFYLSFPSGTCTETATR